MPAGPAGTRGFGRLWRCAGIGLLGIALLGAAAVREFDISIRDRRVEGQSTLRVNRGDTVLLHWRSDEGVSLHVHGYDLEVDLVAATPRTTRFDASIAGRFPVTAHAFAGTGGVNGPTKPHRETALLYLEVLPE